jgi:hypothetical protein
MVISFEKSRKVQFGAGPLYKARRRVSRQILQNAVEAKPHNGEIVAIFKMDPREAIV